jgi:hypothetical protein
MSLFLSGGAPAVGRDSSRSEISQRNGRAPDNQPILNIQINFLNIQAK